MLGHGVEGAKSQLNRRTLNNLLCAWVFVAGLTPIPSATAQSYPSRPLTMVLPFAAGGPTDTLARILAERMRTSLGQPVIIENVPGAAGTLSIGRVVRAAPDGYTLSLGPWNSHVLTGALYTLPFDLQNDLQPVSLIANNPSVIVSKTAAPAKDLMELIAWIKANPDKLSAGTSGVGAATHVAGVLLQKLTGTRFQFVPYRGAGPAVQDLVAGQIDLMIDQISNVLGQVRAGRIRGYAVTSKTRALVAPELPTVDEAGLPEAFETYVKRLEGLEKIASSYRGVEKVFAIQAGREVRVIVLPDHVDDARMTTMSEEIARRIEAELQYPGQIKVVLIRETRAVDFAR